MAITNTQYEKICQFLDAGMDMEAMEAFEAELITNPEMRQQLDFELLVRDGLALGKPPGQNKGLGVVDNNNAVVQRQENPRLRRPNKIWLATAVAASMLLVISLVILYKPNPKKDTAVTDKTFTDSLAAKKQIQPGINDGPSVDSSKTVDGPALFAKYYSKDKIPGTYPIFLADALTRYEAGDYTRLQQLKLADIPDTRGSDYGNSKEKIWQLARYYKAIAFLETGETAKAVSNLNEVLKNNPDNELRARANWYLALAYLKDNAPEKAKEPLKNSISNGRNQDFSKQAKALSALLQK